MAVKIEKLVCSASTASKLVEFCLCLTHLLFILHTGVGNALPQMSYGPTGGAVSMPNQYIQGQMISQAHMGPTQMQPGPGSNQAALAELINFD